MTTLTLVTDVPRNSAMIGLLENWADDIAQASAGLLTIDIFASGELVAAFEVTDAVVGGQVDIGWTATAFSQFPGFAGFDVPLGASLSAGDAEAAWRTVQNTDIEPDGIEILATAFGGDRYLFVDEELNNATGMDGARIRATGDNASILSDLGAATISLPLVETPFAFSTGVIDGFSLSGPFLEFFDLENVDGLLLENPGDNILAPLLRALFINEDSLSRLSETERDILLGQTGLELSHHLGEQIRGIEADLLDASGISPTPIDPGLLSAYQSAVDAFIANDLSAEERAVRDMFQNLSSSVSNVLEDYFALIPGSLGVTDFGELDGATVALETGTQAELDFFNAAVDANISYEPVPIETVSEGIQQFLAGAADVFLISRSDFTAEVQDRILAGDPNIFDVLTGQNISQLPFETGVGPTPGPDTLTGTNSDNAIDGLDGNDTINALDGDDTVNGGDGNDVINGGSGNDSITGGNNFDTISSGEGNDTVAGGNGQDLVFLNQGDDLFLDNGQGGELGRDTVFTGLGNDTVEGGNGDDRFFGEDGNDVINARLGNDEVFGGNGFDTISAGEGNDTVFGGNGQDLVFLNQGNDLFNDNGQGGVLGRDTVFAGLGNDTIEGGNGDDVFHGEDGNDVINGRLGNDTIYGGNNFDTISAGEGNDRVWGGNGQDLVFLNQGDDIFFDNGQGGELGRDTVFTGLGNDTVQGGNGDDRFFGEDGNDLLIARLGNDTVGGGAGNDTIDGGGGSDTLTGAAGVDTFIFAAGDAATGTDLVTDFLLGTDVFQMSGTTAGAVTVDYNSGANEVTVSVGGNDVTVLRSGADLSGFGTDDMIFG